MVSAHFLLAMRFEFLCFNFASLPSLLPLILFSTPGLCCRSSSLLLLQVASPGCSEPPFRAAVLGYTLTYTVIHQCCIPLILLADAERQEAEGMIPRGWHLFKSGTPEAVASLKKLLSFF